MKGREAIYNVATISSNGDKEIGNILAGLYDKMGNHGIITVKEGKTLHHEVENVDGLSFDRGYISPYFLNDDKKQKIDFENCYILIVEKKLGNLRDILPFLELTYQEQKPSSSSQKISKESSSQDSSSTDSRTTSRSAQSRLPPSATTASRSFRTSLSSLEESTSARKSASP